MNLINSRIIGVFLTSFLFYFPTLSFAGNPTTFSSVELMVENFNDYSISNGTFKILKKEPLHIQLSPMVIKEDFPKTIKGEVKRALVYGVYMAFIHTSINRIVVTAIPKEINFKNKKHKYISKYKQTISITRKDALALIKKHINVSSFSNLVTETKSGNMILKDQWTKNFNRIYYNDQGKPGLNLFIVELKNNG